MPKESIQYVPQDKQKPLRYRKLYIYLDFICVSRKNFMRICDFTSVGSGRPAYCWVVICYFVPIGVIRFCLYIFMIFGIQKQFIFIPNYWLQIFIHHIGLYTLYPVCIIKGFTSQHWCTPIDIKYLHAGCFLKYHIRLHTFTIVVFYTSYLGYRIPFWSIFEIHQTPIRTNKRSNV